MLKIAAMSTGMTGISKNTGSPAPSSMVGGGARRSEERTNTLISQQIIQAAKTGQHDGASAYAGLVWARALAMTNLFINQLLNAHNTLLISFYLSSALNFDSAALIGAADVPGKTLTFSMSLRRFAALTSPTSPRRFAALRA